MNKKGLGLLLAAVFLSGSMAGAGVLKLPKSIVVSIIQSQFQKKIKCESEQSFIYGMAHLNNTINKFEIDCR